MIKLITEPYLSQLARWPTNGKHILAQFDEQSIVVYQAYRLAIGHFATSHGYFGGEFSFNRMSWIKPNFLWMMFRSGWGMKEGQEAILAVRIKRTAFDIVLSEAVHSHFVPEVYENESAWKNAIEHSSVRLQWDPDHDPFGPPLERRAIQLGLRGDTLVKYAHEWILDIEDITNFVHEQYPHVLSHNEEQLVTPREEVYPILNVGTAKKLQVSQV